jgi:hypothetical protein
MVISSTVIASHSYSQFYIQRQLQAGDLSIFRHRSRYRWHERLTDCDKLARSARVP